MFEDESDVKGFQLITKATKNTVLRVVRFAYRLFSYIVPCLVSKRKKLAIVIISIKLLCT